MRFGSRYFWIGATTGFILLVGVWFWADPQIQPVIAILMGWPGAVAGGLFVEAAVKYFSSAKSRRSISKVEVNANALKALAVFNILASLCLYLASQLGVYRESEIDIDKIYAIAPLTPTPPGRDLSTEIGAKLEAERKVWILEKNVHTMEAAIIDSQAAYQKSRRLFSALSVVILINTAFGAYFLMLISGAEENRQQDGSAPDGAGQ